NATCVRQQDNKAEEYPCIEYIRRASADLSVNLKVVDTESGLVLAAKTVGGQRTNQKSAKENEPLPFNAKARWLAACRTEAVKTFMRVIAPYQENVRVTLKDDSDFPNLERGNNFAKIGNWADARRAYSTAQQNAANTPDVDDDVKAKILYNLGIAAGYAGDYDQGLRMLGQSYALDPDPGTEAQIRTLKQFKSDDARLEQQRRDAVEGS
ncbi:MAG: tetratricopeptide repeat protein, partial [Myxococcota bacterium]